MGGISGMLGLAGGAGGSGFAGPNSASVINPSNQTQADEQYKNSQAALQQQQAFLQATQAQNGLGNQSSVYNQMQGVANGTGPNPAQAQLAQATGANVANQAALMAGQRGSSSNVGMMARQAAQQGAQTQQQSAGQAATLQAQQSLNALQGMGNMANTMAGQQAAATQANTQAVQGEQSNILNSIAQQNNANVGMQSNINTNNAGLAGQRMGQQANIIGNMAGAIGAAFASGGVVPQKTPNISESRSMYEGGGGVYQQIDPSAPDVFGNQSLSTVPPISSAPIAPAPAPASNTSKGPKSNVGKHFSGNFNAPQSSNMDGASMMGQTAGKAIGAGLKSLFSGSSGKSDGSDDETQQAYLDADAKLSVPGMNNSTDMAASNYESQFAAAHGGSVPALVSPGEQYLPPAELKKVAKGEKDPLKAGERIPGEPEYPGNDYRNDTVKKTLKSGGLVIPNKVMQAKNPHFEAMKFVHAHIAKNRSSLPKKGK